MENGDRRSQMEAASPSSPADFLNERFRGDGPTGGDGPSVWSRDSRAVEEVTVTCSSGSVYGDVTHTHTLLTLLVFYSTHTRRAALSPAGLWGLF